MAGFVVLGPFQHSQTQCRQPRRGSCKAAQPAQAVNGIFFGSSVFSVPVGTPVNSAEISLVSFTNNLYPGQGI